MSVHEDLLNDGENNCSFTEDEVDIMCSKDADEPCGDYCKTTKANYIEIFKFTHFVMIFQFDGNGTNYRNKQLIDLVKVSVVVDLVSGNTSDNEDES